MFGLEDLPCEGIPNLFSNLSLAILRSFGQNIDQMFVKLNLNPVIKANLFSPQYIFCAKYIFGSRSYFKTPTNFRVVH